MERWDDLRYLVAIKKAGTMSGAARLLGANVGTVSRRIERLGAELGVQPFLKTPTGWQPNPALGGLIEVATDFENRLTVELHRQKDAVALRKVPMKLSCPPLVSSLFLFPGLAQLLADAPELHLTISHSVFNTNLGDNDLIITSILPDRGRLMTRKIGSLDFGLYADATHTNADDWIGLHTEHDDSAPIGLGFQHFQRPPSMRLENFLFIAEAMSATKLAGPMPDVLAARKGNCVRIGGSEAACSVELFLCYHETRRGDPAIETLTAWIDRCFQADAPAA